MKLSEKQIEDYITHLDKISSEMCVYPDRMTIDCSDCYLCRVDFFNNVRNDLRKIELEDISQWEK